MALRIRLRWKIVLPCLGFALAPVGAAASLGLFTPVSFTEMLLFAVILIVIALFAAAYFGAIQPFETDPTATPDPNSLSESTESLLPPQPIEAMSIEIAQNLTALRQVQTNHRQRLTLWQQIKDQGSQGQSATNRMADSLQQAQTQLCAVEQLMHLSKTHFGCLQNTLPRYAEEAALNTAAFTASQQRYQRELNLLEQSVSGMSGLYDTTTKAAQSVHQLGQHTEAISQIQHLVNDFAEQTGLLAINASALAAQAGEPGQGFSVLAQKVRSLADRIAEATETTSDIVDELQLATQQTGHLMQQNTDAARHQLQEVAAIYGGMKKLDDDFSRFERTNAQLNERIQPVPSAFHHVKRLEQQWCQTLALLKDGFHLQAQEMLEVEQRLQQAIQLADREQETLNSFEQTLAQLCPLLNRLHQTLVATTAPTTTVQAAGATTTAEVV